MTSINNLKKIEYLNGANLALENAKAHLDVANLSAKSKHYGIASSLLILSIEELAKACALRLKSINNNIPVNNLEKYFKNHKIKQKSIIQIFYSSLGFSIEKGEIKIEKKEAYVIVFVIIIAIIYSYTNKNKTINPKSEYDKIKESGFYFSYCEVNRKWISPQENYDIKNFKPFKESIDDLFEIIELNLFGDKINESNIIEFAESMDNVIDQKQLAKLKATINKG